MPGWNRQLAAFALLAIASPARADDAAAERWFSDGTAALDRDQPAVAAAAFRAAWQAEPRAKIAIDLGVALAETGNIAGAAEAFEIYLADPACDGGKRPVIERQLDAWRPRLGRIALHVTPDDATVEIDGVRPLRTGGVVDVPAAPGRHRIVIDRAGYERRSLAVVVVVQQTVESSEQLVALALPPAPEQRPPSRKPMWIAVCVAGAAALVGTTASIVAIERWNTVHTRCPGDVCASSSDLTLADHARHAGYVADGAFAVTGAALIAAAWFWHRSPQHSQISIAPTRSGGMVAWQVAY